MIQLQRLCIIHVIDKTAWCSHKNVDATPQSSTDSQQLTVRTTIHIKYLCNHQSQYVLHKSAVTDRAAGLIHSTEVTAGITKDSNEAVNKGLHINESTTKSQSLASYIFTKKGQHNGYTTMQKTNNRTALRTYHIL